MSFSGIKSNFNNAQSANDLISKVILSTPNGGSPTGNYGHVILGSLLIQFTTGYNNANGTITLPIAYDAGTGNSTGWYEPYTIFTLCFSAGSLMSISSRNPSNFTGTFVLGNGWWWWITIGPIPSSYSNASASFSGYKSLCNSAWSAGDLFSDIFLTTYSSNASNYGPNRIAQYGHVIVGGLLIQFTTGYQQDNAIINLPIIYDNPGTGSAVGWTRPYFAFIQALNNNHINIGTSTNPSTFEIYFEGGSGTGKWMTIGHIPSGYTGN